MQYRQYQPYAVWNLNGEVNVKVDGDIIDASAEGGDYYGNAPSMLGSLFGGTVTETDKFWIIAIVVLVLIFKKDLITFF